MTLGPARRAGSGIAPFLVLASLGAVVTGSLTVLAVTAVPRLARRPAVSAAPVFDRPGSAPVAPVPPAAPAVPPAPVGVAMTAPVAAPPAEVPAPPPDRTVVRPARPLAPPVVPGAARPLQAAPPPAPAAAPPPPARFLRGEPRDRQYPDAVSVLISDLPYLLDNAAALPSPLARGGQRPQR